VTDPVFVSQAGQSLLSSGLPDSNSPTNSEFEIFRQNEAGGE